MANQIKNGAVISYVTIILSFCLGLIYTPWMIRQIGISDYGLYGLSAAFLSYFILDFGLGEAIARYVSLAVVKKDIEQINKILSTAMCIYLIIDVIIICLLFVCYFFLENIFDSLTPIEIERFKVVFCITSLFSVMSFPLMPMNGIMIANERFIVLKFCDLFNKLIMTVLTVICLLLGYGLYALVIVHALVGFLIALYKGIYVKKNLKYSFRFDNYCTTIAKSLFKFSIWIFIIGIAQRLSVNICPTILGMKANTTEISIFSVAMMLEGYVWTFANALNGLFMPRVASLSLNDGNRSHVTDLMIKVGRLQLFLVGLVISGIVIFGKQFLVLWMGDDFSKTYFVLLMMIITGLIGLTQSIANTLLYVENEVRYRSMFFMASSIVSFIISWILCGSIGAIGCGIGILVSNIFCLLCMNIVYYRILHLDIPRFFKECHLKMLVPLVLLTVSGLYVFDMINDFSWGILFLSGLCYVLLYVIVLWFVFFDITEKELILNMIQAFKIRLLR